MTESIRFGCLIVYHERVFNWLEQQQVFEAFARESQTYGVGQESAPHSFGQKAFVDWKSGVEMEKNGFGVGLLDALTSCDMVFYHRIKNV